MRTGVVVVEFNNHEQTKKCLSLIKNADVFHHDNSKENLGFTKAYNLGIQALRHDHEYILILNSDCYLHEGFIEKMEQFMDYNVQCGIAGAKQVASDHDTIVHAGCTQAYPYGVHITGKLSLQMHTQNTMVPWVNGACMMVRSRAIDDIGLMDENYFLIGSDSDWCYTARARGWEIWYCAQASCTHDGGVSQTPGSKEQQDAMYLDMMYWRDKWVTGDLYKKLCAS